MYEYIGGILFLIKIIACAILEIVRGVLMAVYESIDFMLFILKVIAIFLCPGLSLNEKIQAMLYIGFKDYGNDYDEPYDDTYLD